MQCLVSIIVPVYKSGDTIEKCILSIINQTYSNIEVLLVLDGEFDKSGSICRQYESKDKRIHVFTQGNQGVSVARNLGIKYAKGEWICFVDSDDYLRTDFVQEMVDVVNIYDYDILICDYYVVDGENIRKESFFENREILIGKENKRDIIKSCLIPIGNCNKSGVTNIGVPWAKFYKQSFLKDKELCFVPGLNRMQDTIFNLYSFSECSSIGILSKSLYYYYRNAYSSTIGYREDFDKTAEMIISEIVLFNKKYKIFSEQEINTKKFLLFLEIIDLQYLHPKCSLSFWGKMQKIKTIYELQYYKKAISDVDISLLNTKQRMQLLFLRFNCIEMVYLLKKVNYISKKHFKE